MDDVPDAPPPRRRRPTADIRSDFDDDFGRRPTPFDVARRRLMGPALAHLATGVLGVMAMLILAVIGVVAYVNDEWDLFELALGESGFFLGGCLFAVIALGGLAMLRLRHRWLALVSAFVVTALASASCFGLFFYPFGVWALVVLYRPDVRRQFGKSRPPLMPPVAPPPEAPAAGESSEPPVKPPRQPRERLMPIAVAFLGMGTLGVLAMFVTCCWILWDSETGGNYWSELEVIWCVGLTLSGAGAFAIILIGGFCLLRVRHIDFVRLAAYLMASIPLIGLAFGARALILLHQNDVRREFQRPGKVKDGT